MRYAISTIHYTRCTKVSTLRTLQYTLHTIRYTTYTIHCTRYTIQYAIYTTHYRVYTVRDTLYTILYTLCTIHFTLYTIFYIIYTAHYTIQSAYLRPCPPPCPVKEAEWGGRKGRGDVGIKNRRIKQIETGKSTTEVDKIHGMTVILNEYRKRCTKWCRKCCTKCCRMPHEMMQDMLHERLQETMSGMAIRGSPQPRKGLQCRIGVYVVDTENQRFVWGVPPQERNNWYLLWVADHELCTMGHEGFQRTSKWLGANRPLVPTLPRISNRKSEAWHLNSENLRFEI